MVFKPWSPWKWDRGLSEDGLPQLRTKTNQYCLTPRVPAAAQCVKSQTAVVLGSCRGAGSIPSLVSGLRIQHCCSCGVGRNCGLDSIPGLGTSICCARSHKLKTKIKILPDSKKLVFMVLGGHVFESCHHGVVWGILLILARSKMQKQWEYQRGCKRGWTNIMKIREAKSYTGRNDASTDFRHTKTLSIRGKDGHPLYTRQRKLSMLALRCFIASKNQLTPPIGWKCIQGLVNLNTTVLLDSTTCGPTHNSHYLNWKIRAG